MSARKRQLEEHDSDDEMPSTENSELARVKKVNLNRPITMTQTKQLFKL